MFAAWISPSIEAQLVQHLAQSGVVVESPNLSVISRRPFKSLRQFVSVATKLGQTTTKHRFAANKDISQFDYRKVFICKPVRECLTSKSDYDNVDHNDTNKY